MPTGRFYDGVHGSGEERLSAASPLEGGPSNPAECAGFLLLSSRLEKGETYVFQ